MFKTGKWLVFIVVLILSGCKTISIAETSFSDKGILLDQVNLKAKGDVAWFDSDIQGRQKITENYKGELSPGLAVYH